MAKRNQILASLAAIFLAIVTGKPATAFTVTLTGLERSYQEYRTKDSWGYTWLELPEAIPKDSAEQGALLGQLFDFARQSNETWDIDFAQQDLKGSFDFSSYLACGYDDKCGAGITDAYGTKGVGAEMELAYRPVGDDPTASLFGGTQLFWIQRVKSNHSILDIHGTNEDTLDRSLDNTTTPYYSSARNYGFSDAPFRQDYQNDHIWDAELYLATETREADVKKVRIYNGVKWGWRNKTFIRDHADICDYPDIENCINNPPNKPIDLAMVFDTTGSMGSILGEVKSAMQNLSKTLFEQVPNSRIAVVDYKDFPVSPFGGLGDYPYQADLPFSSNLTSINATINGLSTGGGGDTPESLWSALTRTIKTEGLGDWRNKVKKSVIYVTDAPAHDPEPFTGYTASSIADEAFSVDPAVIYGIVPSYLKDDPQLSILSRWTGGKLFAVDRPDDVKKALADILASINGAEISEGTKPPRNPQSVPESTPILGLLAILLALGRIRR